jgi:ornithine cyclodeaminase/alanine dehydrogenase-like protein (mu-crystallin family)
MDQLILELSNALKSYERDKMHIPIRSGFNYQTPNPGLVEFMPIYSEGEEVILKVVGYHPENPNSIQMPSILSTIYSYDTETGHLNAIVDGVLLTALRTGAASAIASQLMANPESSILGLIGCGTQAITQLHALSRVFPLKKILFYDKDPKVVENFNDRIKVLDLTIEANYSPIDQIVKNADILCTATSIDIGAGPLFKDLETKPHLHINAIGSDFPGKTELPIRLLKNSLVCPDFKEQALIEGECQQLDEAEIGPSIIELIKNQKQFGGIKNRLTVFDSTGWALQDKVVMQIFLDYAYKREIGHLIEIESISRDAKNPYHFLDSLELSHAKLAIKSIDKVSSNPKKHNKENFKSR